MSATRVAAASAAAVLTLLVAACGSTAPGTSSSNPPPGQSSSSTAASVSVADPWIKATDGTMTGAFGSVVNTGPAELTVVSAASEAARMVELHETVTVNGATVMRPRADGFTVPAGGTLTLEPGGSHLMLMGLTRPLLPGETVTVTLTLSSGATVPFTALVKEFSGGNETYEPATPSAG